MSFLIGKRWQSVLRDPAALKSFLQPFLIGKRIAGIHETAHNSLWNVTLISGMTCMETLRSVRTPPCSQVLLVRWTKMSLPSLPATWRSGWWRLLQEGTVSRSEGQYRHLSALSSRYGYPRVDHSHSYQCPSILGPPICFQFAWFAWPSSAYIPNDYFPFIFFISTYSFIYPFILYTLSIFDTKVNFPFLFLKKKLSNLTSKIFIFKV